MHTTGQHGYVANPNNNMFQVLEDGASVTDDDTSVATITNQTAANTTTGSTLDNTYAASLAPANPSPSPQDYVAAATAINQLSANQMVMWSHMQNLSLCDHAPPTHVANPVVYNLPRNAVVFQAPYQAPPIHALTVPAPFQAGRCGGRGQGGRTRRHPSRGGCSPNPFGPVGLGAGTMYVPDGVVQPPYGLYPPTLTPATVQCNTWTLIMNYNNWNVCYTCGFDVEAKHNLMTFPFNWRKPGHCKNYTRKNAQSYIDCEHNVCTKGIHKTMLPLA